MKYKESVNRLTCCLSWIVHLLFLLPTIYIVTLCVQMGFSLTTLHTAVLTIGCGFLLTEGTLVVSGEALLVAKVSRKTRIRIHWVLNTLGLVLVVAGVVVIEIQKFNRGSYHFTSDHGKLGLAGIVVILAVGVTAIPTVEPRLRPKTMCLFFAKLFHVCTGIVGIVLLLAGQITGLYKRWWPGSELDRNLCYAAYVVGAFLLLIRPTYSWGSRIYEMSK